MESCGALRSSEDRLELFTWALGPFFMEGGFCVDIVESMAHCDLVEDGSWGLDVIALEELEEVAACGAVRVPRAPRKNTESWEREEDAAEEDVAGGGMGDVASSYDSSKHRRGQCGNLKVSSTCERCC